VIDMQLLNDALAALALIVGLVILLSVWIVAAAALTHRHERTVGVRQVERFLAAVAERQSPAAKS